MDEDNLNNQDVINLAENPSIDNKSLIAEKITALYNSPHITPILAKLSEDIFRIMIKDTEIKVRQALASCLKNCSYLPLDIIENILNDNDSVAIPFIQYYEALTDDDLIKIINSQNPNRQKAISLRHNISYNLSDYIVNNCSQNIISTLISNEGASIKETTFNTIISKYPDDENIKNLCS